MSELSEAEERLRRRKAGEPLKAIYGRSGPGAAMDIEHDCMELAHAYLAEHHADDGDKLNSPEAIDWLDGLSRVDGDGLPMLTVQLKDDGLHLVNNNWVSPRVATKGDVRTLCRALGIELQETRDG